MIFQRGRTWWYEFQYMGQRVRESSHSRSRSVALRGERKRRTELEESFGVRPARRRPVLFSVAARDYLKAKEADIKASSLRIERKNLDHLLPSFGKMLLTDISGANVREYQRGRGAEGAAGATINLEVGTLRAIMRRHRLWANIQPDVKRRPEREDVGTALSREAEKHLLAACMASRSRLLYPAVVLTLNTGLRRSELLSVRWSQIDFIRRVLRVGESKTRAGANREMPLNTEALNALTDWAAQFPGREPDHFVFPTERVGASGDAFEAAVTDTDPSQGVGTLKTAWTTARARAGVKLRWHDLRHTACTRLLEAGLSLPMVGSLLGWSPSTTVRMAHRYGHFGPDARRDAMERISARAISDTWLEVSDPEGARADDEDTRVN